MSLSFYPSYFFLFLVSLSSSNSLKFDLIRSDPPQDSFFQSLITFPEKLSFSLCLTPFFSRPRPNNISSSGLRTFSSNNPCPKNVEQFLRRFVLNKKMILSDSYFLKILILLRGFHSKQTIKGGLNLPQYRSQCTSEQTGTRGAAVAQWISPAAPGSNLNHTIYTFIKMNLSC